MQCAVIEFARHVMSLSDANSSEMEQTPHPVIDLMEEQKGVTAKGGTMRLGAYPCTLKKGSKVAAAYGKLNISGASPSPLRVQQRLSGAVRGGRHEGRGRGIPDTNLVEVVEIENHHPGSSVRSTIPNTKSTVLSPSPLFVAL